jgi:hypothetical protein
MNHHAPIARRCLSRALNTSALVWVLALPAAANAQCAPDPTVANTATTCTGSDTDGIRITTPGSTLNVNASATVSNNGAPAITVEVPNTTSPINEKIVVAGQVDGGSYAAINLLTGQPAIYNGSMTHLALTVAAGGQVSGSTALATGQSIGSNYGQLVTTIDNAGTITGSSGVALRGDAVTSQGGYIASYSAFDSITNRATGVITGSIVGPVASLNNAGLIDGGNGSALTVGNSVNIPYTINPGTWTNSGTIQSNSTTATISSSTINTLTNGGSIKNSGTGAALSSGYLDILNQAGAKISSGGGAAIVGSSVVRLTNLGTIDGNVVTGGALSVIDSSQGHINGSVLFGSANNTLVVGYDGTSTLVTGVSGTIHGGPGSNTEILAIHADATISAPVTLLAGFQGFGISTDKGVTTTLGTGFTTATSIEVSGSGTLINEGMIKTSNPAFVLDGASSPGIGQFLNKGSIETTFPHGAAVIAQNQYGLQITNDGVIKSAGAGISASSALVVNTGTITAYDIGVQGGGILTNSGTIRSETYTGFYFFGSGTSTNSGTIQGASAGVDTNGFLINSGTITATNVGAPAVKLEFYGGISNAAGGVIGSGGLAITGNAYGTSVTNAGTINGTVSLAYNNLGGSQGERYISQPGGVLNGNLILGSGGVLVTDLANSGPGQFAGINGTVTAASGAQLRYRVTGTESATIGPVGPFATPSFQLTDGASLTLTAPGTVTTQLQLAGTGTVDLNANLSATTVPALITTTAFADVPTSFDNASALSITSRGTIAVTVANGSMNSLAAGISLTNADSFTNIGTIKVTDRNALSFTSGISVGAGVLSGTVTNAGSILLDGGFGISGGQIVNTGTITQIAGGASAGGVSGPFSLNNSGTISVGGIAVTAYNGSVITNSGTISSTGGVAITGNSTSTSATITNAAGGTIGGIGGTAIRLYYGTFTNAGTVNGTVDMGYGYPSYSGAPVRSYASSTYVAAGGTITGDLLFGDSPDLLLQTSDTLGVSGTIDGGGGTNIYGHSLTTSGTFSLDPVGLRNFQDGLIQAVGPDTVVTATATGTFNGNLYVAGTGSVINQASITGMLTTTLPSFLNTTYVANPLFPSDQIPSSITNAGSIGGGVQAVTPSFTNSGTITSTGPTSPYGPYNPTVLLWSNTNLTFVNSGTISPSGSLSAYAATVALTTGQSASITNSGTIGGTGMSATIAGLADNSVHTIEISNSGTISSSNEAAALNVTNGYLNGPATVRIDNSGTIAGQTNGIILTGSPIAATIVNEAGGSISARSINYAYAISAQGASIDLTNAGTITATGPTGSVAILGSYQGYANTIRNTGTIIGDILLGDGADTVDNAGTINGAVKLGAGDDTFVERASGSVSGGVDGGDGANSYRVVLAGDRNGISARTNFQQLSVEGSGTLTLALDQNFQSVALSGGNLNVALGGYTIGRIDGSAAPAKVAVDGDVAIVALGSGDDTLALGTTNAAGRYDGGAGANTLRFTATTPVTLTGTVTNFQTVSLAGGALAVAGMLGQAGATIGFGDSAQSLTVASGGTLAGTIDLGAGDDNFRLAAGGTLLGRVAGGAGNDTATLELAQPMTLVGGTLTGFERLVTEGRGTLTLTGGASNFATINAAGDVTIAADASLATSQLAFGAAGGHLTIAGGFTGSVAGGAGNDSIDISSGSATSPVAFGTISDVEALRISAGFATVAGTASLGSIALTGGRLVGLAGSTISAPTINVGTNATFGSAGTVNGNIAVSGTLSPGASPGTMTVNGNVALAGSSISLFEITPTVSDKLVVNGTVSIAQGATLQLVPSDGVKPGQSLDLIVASGGISGSFTNIVKPASLFGVVVAQSGKLTLLGEFLNDTSFSPQVQRSVDYVNSVLTSGKASAALLAAVPQLVTSSGASNQAAFAEITPEAYASARQLTVEQGLELADAGRSDAFATHRDTAGAFSFASTLGDTRTLRSNSATGTSRARTNGYGFLGGLGWGSQAWSIGGFIGSLNSHQNLALPGTKTNADGFVAGIHGRWTDGSFGLKATIAYDGSKATTRRALPGSSATGDYHLHGWTADASLDYAIALGGNWTIRPSIGATAIRATRDRVVESGGNAFALDVARDRGNAVFVDGALTVSGGTQSDATVRPFLSVGVRHQFDGRTPYALAALGGGDYGLTAAGAPRASVLATATLGTDVVLSQRLVLFGAVSGEAGNADRRGSAHAGLRLAF